jgi:hypothetical protein
MVEGAVRVAAHDAEHLIGAESRSVGTVGAQCLGDVCDSEDPGRLIQLLRDEPTVVAAAIQPFVMSSGDLRHRLEGAHPGKDLHRPLGMATNRAPLGLVQPARLVEDAV